MKVLIEYLISISDIIGWVYAALGAFIAYMVLHRMQNNRERHTMVKDIESTVNELFSRQDARALCQSDDNSYQMMKVTYRSVLHDESPWLLYKSSRRHLIDGQRYIQIRDDHFKDEVSTGLLHETLILFRRVQKLYLDKIIKPQDLCDIWREILPFLHADKIEFFESYFGKTDVQPILNVAFWCLRACIEVKHESALTYMRDNLTTTDHQLDVSKLNDYLKRANKFRPNLKERLKGKTLVDCSEQIMKRMKTGKKVREMCQDNTIKLSIDAITTEISKSTKDIKDKYVKTRRRAWMLKVCVLLLTSMVSVSAYVNMMGVLDPKLGGTIIFAISVLVSTLIGIDQTLKLGDKAVCEQEYYLEISTMDKQLIYMLSLPQSEDVLEQMQEIFKRYLEVRTRFHRSRIFTIKQGFEK